MPRSFSIDFLVVGRGLAGVRTALELATAFPDKKVGLVSKDQNGESSSIYAQGGIAASSGMDCLSHLRDTMKAGCFWNDTDIVRNTIEQSQETLDWLQKQGVVFSEERGLEGGHSQRRVYNLGDETGRSLMTHLNQKIACQNNITQIKNHILLELLKEESTGACSGAVFLNGDSVEFIPVKHAVFLCSGGFAGLYAATTNSHSSLGECLEAAARLGAQLKDLAFVQFHPTTFKISTTEEMGRRDLITEALRGEGAIVCNARGEPFLDSCGQPMGLMTRDILSRFVYTKNTSSDQVYLDCRHMSSSVLSGRFAFFSQQCKRRGIDPKRDLIAIEPAAHYSCGGLAVDRDARVLNEKRQPIEGLFAVGEAACTGLHGANRLASNSLLEALVFAKKAIDFQRNFIFQDRQNDATPKGFSFKNCERTRNLILSHVQEILLNSMGPMRTQEVIEKGQQRLISLNQLGKLDHLAGMYLTFADRILKAGHALALSVGCHYRSDL